MTCRSPLATLLNFDYGSTPKKCCNRPKIVAIAEIVTLFLLGGIAGACVGKALDNAFLGSVANCVLVATLRHCNIRFCYGCRCGKNN